MKERPRKTARAALATAMAVLPMTFASTLHAQGTPVKPLVGGVESGTARATFLKFNDRFHKESSSYALVGIDNGNTVYKNARGEYFSLDPATGDMKFLAPQTFIKFSEAPTKAAPGTPLRMMKWNAIKFAGAVTILGFDQAGHVVQQNARGERFYLNPTTGDMVFVK